MFFADDTQFYIAVDDTSVVQPKFQQVMEDISALMLKKRLKLNGFRTEVT